MIKANENYWIWGFDMDKSDYLQLMRLLSALEALVVAHKVHIPDYVYDWLGEAALKLEKEILK